MFDVIAIGDCVIDTYVPIQDADIEFRHGKRELVLRYGEKVPVGPSITFVGGNAANDAVGSSRLGLRTTVYTNVGNDQDAERVIKKLKSERIDTRYVVFNKDLSSNHNVVLDYKGERTILSYHQPWNYNLPELDRTKFVYLSSLSPNYIDSPIIDQLINYLERTNPKLVYNPGTFQIRQGAKKNAKLLFYTELLVLNLEEAKYFLGHDIGEKIDTKKLMIQIADLGPRKVVITNGGKGSYGFDGDKFYKLGVFPAHLVEMTGAGDAYASGTMSGLFHGNSLPDSMRWGTANSAAVVEYVGPQAGLLNYDQMQQRLTDNAKIVSIEF